LHGVERIESTTTSTELAFDRLAMPCGGGVRASPCERRRICREAAFFNA